MDIMRFPVAAGTTSVARALAMMKDEHISGVVVPAEGHVHLIGYGDLISQRTPGRLRLNRVGAMRVGPLIVPAYARRMKLLRAPTMGMSQVELQKIEKFLIESGYTYAAFGPVSRYANLLSLYEKNLDLFRLAPQDCYCTNLHRPHPYGPNHPERCTFDKTPIVCG